MHLLTTCSWAGLLLGGTLAGAALAQERGPADADAPLPVPGQVLSDAEILPAESRDSAGAVLLHHSPVRAQQRSPYAESAARNGVGSTIGRNVQRIVDRARGWDSLREAGADPVPGDAAPAQRTD